MPWKTTTPMEEALRFVTLAQTERFTLTELCGQFCISRRHANRVWLRNVELDSGGVGSLRGEKKQEAGR
ncbi:hypothetical protein IMCC26134_10365 [Verrucomicrobia bacterium IMCC26134]|nr:hypothetical protein IMCC26134_10365 [Verrucomicrobia bacterium IMCC26134]